MKKILSILFLLGSFTLFAVESTNGTMDYKQGDDVYCPVDGKVAQVGNKNLPSVFTKDSVVIDFPFEYTYKNKKMNVNYQIIFSGVISNYKAGENVVYNGILGTATKNQKLVNIRCRDFDPYLASISRVKPVLKDGWYYFGIALFLPNSFKVLDYPLAVNKNFVIQFSDYPESLEALYKNGLYTHDGKPIETNVFPYFNICLKTKFKSYPVPVKVFSPSAKITEAVVQRKYFSNCTHMLETEFDSIPVRYYFQDKFYDYLKKEYKLEKDIYLYCTVICQVNGDMFLYVRDFTLESPDEYVEKKIQGYKN